MFKAVPSPYLVPFQGPLSVKKLPTKPPKGAPGRKESKALLADQVDTIETLQRKLYASNRHALLLVFQAMDAAGKDSTIRAVLTGVNPAGFQVYSFKAPSVEELDHDFLWRTTKSLPERGRIGVFNRSYYEEVLVVRVHPEFLAKQHLPGKPDPNGIWKERFASIRDHETHLAHNGVVVVKFWLNVSRDEQRKRFLSRIDEPHKRWKFSTSDLEERGHWNAYMKAYEEALAATSRPWAPWYAIPADDKPFMRLTVAGIIADTLKSLKLRFPRMSKEREAELLDLRHILEKKG